MPKIVNPEIDPVETPEYDFMRHPDLTQIRLEAMALNRGRAVTRHRLAELFSCECDSVEFATKLAAFCAKYGLTHAEFGPTAILFR